MVFRHGFFHSDPHPANIFVLESGALGLVDFGQAGKLTDDDMAGAHTALRRRRDGEHRRDPASPARARRPLRRCARGRVSRGAAGPLRPLLRHPALGHRPDPGDPRGLPAHLRDEPQASEPLRHPRQGDRDARVGRAGGVPGLQRLRGCEAVRTRPARRSLPPACALAASARRGDRAGVGRSRPAVPGVGRARAVCATGTFQVHIENPGIDEIDDHIDKATNRIAVAVVILGGLMGSAIIGVFAEGRAARRRNPPARAHRLPPRGGVRRLARVGHPPARSPVAATSRTRQLRNACREYAAKDI